MGVRYCFHQCVLLDVFDSPAKYSNRLMFCDATHHTTCRDLQPHRTPLGYTALQSTSPTMRYSDVKVRNVLQHNHLYKNLKSPLTHLNNVRFSNHLWWPKHHSSHIQVLQHPDASHRRLSPPFKPILHNNKPSQQMNYWYQVY